MDKYRNVIYMMEFSSKRKALFFLLLAALILTFIVPSIADDGEPDPDLEDAKTPGVLGWDYRTLTTVFIFLLILVLVALISRTKPSWRDDNISLISGFLIIFLLIILTTILIWEVNIDPKNCIWGAVIVIVIVFVMLVYIGLESDGTLDQGEMRRAIAATFVVGFTILIMLLATCDIENNETTSAYLQMVGVIVGFYFGAKTALSGKLIGKNDEMEKTALSIESKKDEVEKTALSIENLKFGNEGKKRIVLSVRNLGETLLKVDRIYMDGNPQKTDVAKIEPESLNDVQFEYDWAPDTKYKVKVATVTGVVAEGMFSSPPEQAEG